MRAGSRAIRHEKKWGPRLLWIAVAVAAAFALSVLAVCGTASASDRGLEKYKGIDGKASMPSIAAAEDGSLYAAGDILYQQNDARYYYWGAWSSATDAKASGGSYWYANSDSSIMVVFLGTHLTWYARTGPTYGKAKAHADGSGYETVDLYSSTVRYGAVWDTGVLDYGTHSVEIEWTGTKNELATGTSISVDAFSVDGPILDADSKGTGTISGTVKNSSGVGVAGVYVTAMNLALGPVGVTVTRSNGSYSLTELPNELVVVQTYNLKDYVDEWYNNIPYPGHIDASGATWLNLAATPSRSGISFTLASGRSISGYVRDAQSIPLFNQEVDVYDLSGDLVNSMVTDGTGLYWFQGLPPGQYRVCTQNDLGYVDEWYDDHPFISDPDGSSATIIDISTSSATGKDFVLETGRTIAGRVTGSSGGLANVEVRVQPSTGGISLYTWTDGTGSYQMGGLPSGLFVANTANDQGYVDEWYDNDPAPADLFGDNAQDIDLTGGNQLAINFALDRGYTISGYVTDYETGSAVPDPGVYVEVYNGAGTLYSYSLVGGAAGTRYESFALPAGTYYVKTSDYYFLGYVDKWYANKPCWLYTLSDAAPVVLSTADVGNINFQMEWMNLYDQTDSHIYYAPSATAWTVYSATGASGGSYSYSAATNAAATIFFYGNRLDAIVMKGTTTGSADFFVDGEKTDTINLAATAATYNVKVFTTGILPSGPHKVEIKYTSTNASGKRITLDAVEVAGELTYAVPVITSVAPTTGFTTGGDSVVITGTDLGGAATVTFGGMLASITSNSATQIVAVTPAHAAGPVRVQATTSAGTTTDTSADDFTYVTPGVPTITSLSPNTGSMDGGASVTITGTNFAGLSGPSAVTFGGVDAKSYVRVSATTITAVAPAHAAGSVRVQVTAAGGGTEDSPNDDFTYTETPPVTRYDVATTNANLVKTGTWVDYTSLGSWSGSYGRSSTSSASATLWFTGTQIAYVAFKGTTTGYADVYIDNVKQTTVNLTAPAPTYQQPVWTSPVLANGLHSFKVVRNNTLSGTKYVTLDAVEITGTIAAPPSRYEQINASIHKTTGVWADFSNATASNSSYGRSLTADASATIHFTGERIDYIGFKGTTTGWVEVWLDGELKGTIDLAATTAAGNQLIWSSGTIGGGSHTLVLKRSGTSLATEYLTLDAVDIWGAIAP